MSDDEDEVKLEPRPLTPPQVDSNVFKNAAFGNMNTLRFLVDGEAAAPAAVEEGEEGEDAKGEEEKTDAATGLEAVDLNARDEFGATALCWACRNGALPSVEYLVAKGANIESAGYGEMRPLHFAANFAREKVVKLLLKNGADVDAKDGGGNTPLHWAGAKCVGLGCMGVPVSVSVSASQLRDALRLLGLFCFVLFLFSSTSYLCCAMCNRGVLTVVTLLVEAGAGLMASNNSGATPLHKAANGGHVRLVVVCG